MNDAYEFSWRTTIRLSENAYANFWTPIQVSRFAAKHGTGPKRLTKRNDSNQTSFVLNITMPVLNGIEAAREITAKLPETAIVILSSHADKYFIEQARKNGARAFVAKTKAGEALVEAIETAVGGREFVLVD